MKLGILGAGQLGRMLSLAARPLGIQTRFFDPKPAQTVEHLGEVVQADFADTFALGKFSEGIAAATFEFENVPADSVHFLEKQILCRPDAAVLRVTQDRLFEKQLFNQLKIPTTKFQSAENAAQLEAILSAAGEKCVVKTRRMGYDGKGQMVLEAGVESVKAWRSLGEVPLIVEEWIGFEAEAALIGARDTKGNCCFYPLVETAHVQGILAVARAPGRFASTDLQAKAEQYMKKLFEHLNYTGILTVEFFVRKGELIANEIAPRVHNSGHWSIEGAETSQFENHIRSVMNLPLGSTRLRQPSIVLNLIGGIPPLQQILSVSGAHVHLYEKKPQPKRKLGHVTLCAENAETLDARLKVVGPLIESARVL